MNALLAQLVERDSNKVNVVGSIPTRSNMLASGLTHRRGRSGSNGERVFELQKKTLFFNVISQ